MTVALGDFARSSFEGRFGDDTAAGVQAALLHYSRRLKAGRKPLPVPRWLRDHASGEKATSFELPVDPETWSSIEREADRQGVPTEQLVTHAVFVYVADLDAASTP